MAKIVNLGLLLMEQTKPDITSLVHEYSDDLFRFALYRVSDRSAAEDIVQETFLAAVRKHGSFQSKSSEKTWLIGILKHKILDHYRKSYRGLDRNLELAPDIDEFFDTNRKWKEMPSAWTSNPEQVLANKDFTRILSDCIKKLKEIQKRAFLAREVDDTSMEELCKILSITATNLGVILYRARMRLRQCLQENWFNEASE